MRGVKIWLALTVKLVFCDKHELPEPRSLWESALDVQASFALGQRYEALVVMAAANNFAGFGTYYFDMWSKNPQKYELVDLRRAAVKRLERICNLSLAVSTDPRGVDVREDTPSTAFWKGAAEERDILNNAILQCKGEINLDLEQWRRIPIDAETNRGLKALIKREVKKEYLVSSLEAIIKDLIHDDATKKTVIFDGNRLQEAPEAKDFWNILFRLVFELPENKRKLIEGVRLSESSVADLFYIYYTLSKPEKERSGNRKATGLEAIIEGLVVANENDATVIFDGNRLQQAPEAEEFKNLLFSLIVNHDNRSQVLGGDVKLSQSSVADMFKMYSALRKPEKGQSGNRKATGSSISTPRSSIYSYPGNNGASRSLVSNKKSRKASPSSESQGWAGVFEFVQSHESAMKGNHWALIRDAFKTNTVDPSKLLEKLKKFPIPAPRRRRIKTGSRETKRRKLIEYNG